MIHYKYILKKHVKNQINHIITKQINTIIFITSKICNSKLLILYFNDIINLKRI